MCREFGNNRVAQSDERAATLAARGDADAFMILVQRYRAPLIGYLCGLLGDRDQAEELTQEAFCRAWEKIPTLRQPKRFGAWLYAVARNAARTAGRRKPTVRLTDESAGAADPEPSVDEWTEVHNAVAALPERQRAVVVLRYYSGLSHRQVAEVLGIPEGTVRSRLSRAYATLRNRLGHLLEDC